MQKYDNVPDNVSDNNKSNNTREVVLIIGVLLFVVLAFIVFRRLSANSNVSTNSDTQIDMVDAVSTDTSSVNNKVTTVYNMSDRFYSDVDETLDGDIMKVTYISVDSKTEFVGDGTHYRLVIVGQLRNVGDTNVDVRVLPDLVVNGVTMDKSLSVPSLSYKGVCEYKYSGVFDDVESLEGPYVIELPNDNLSGTYERLWTMTSKSELSGEVSGVLADGSAMSSDDYSKFRSPITFSSDITSNEVFMNGIGEKLGSMFIAVADAFSWDRSTFDDFSFYTVVDTRFSVKDGKTIFEADVRNNLYHETADNIEMVVTFLDDTGMSVTSDVLKSNHKLKPGEVVTLSCTFDGIDTYTPFFGETSGFFDLDRLVTVM